MLFSINDRFEAIQIAPQYSWSRRCPTQTGYESTILHKQTVRSLQSSHTKNPPPDARSVACTPRFTASCMQLSSRPGQRPHRKGKASRSAISGHAARHPTNALPAHELMAGVSMRGDILDSIARLGQRQRENSWREPDRSLDEFSPSFEKTHIWPTKSYHAYAAFHLIGLMCAFVERPHTRRSSRSRQNLRVE